VGYLRARGSYNQCRGRWQSSRWLATVVTRVDCHPPLLYVIASGGRTKSEPKRGNPRYEANISILYSLHLSRVDCHVAYKSAPRNDDGVGYLRARGKEAIKKDIAIDNIF